ncbi:aspartate/glutamate racemase family protein [Salipiger mucosus]|uniref:Aspartate/glutamate racemase family protein n=1 Tax=Salipiger mucosus DSM 16094 TaxID=1123237 RepID=S9Q3A1_9RHOB|nr:aspartate/glutamate racemase family protein [Salipiger mucosus]EPX75816.1 hypothetical protein Salmuc_03103 [Salipiger mucosus DSM 16094]
MTHDAPSPSVIASGGKAVYGAPLGILMLEARFARIPGDMGHAETWPFPVLYRVIRGADPGTVVLNKAAGLREAFLEGARELVELGAEAITTNCGFLSILQPDLAEALGVPVATSSLMQVPWVQAMLPPGKRPGVVTISSGSLTPAHLEGVGVPQDTPVEGTDTDGEFFRVIIGAEKDDLDVIRARDDVISAAQRLVRRHPEVGALVLECTNMAPYAADVSAATGLPVFDIHSLVRWLQLGVRPQHFPMPRGGRL